MSDFNFPSFPTDLVRYADPIDVLSEAFSEGIRPDPLLTVSEWADANRVLSSKESEPGRWRTARAPFLREIMDCLSVSSSVSRIALMKGAQLGGTECGLNFEGYVIDAAPGTIMHVVPTHEDIKKVTRRRITPMIEECPSLRKRVASGDKGRTDAIGYIEFPGGELVVVNSGSGAALRSLPCRFLFLDEVDAYPTDVTDEGDPVSLAVQRVSAQAAKGRSKVFAISTPTIKGRSRIEADYLNGDQRQYFVPCPHCGEFQVLKWAGVRWDDDAPQKAWYECAHCKQAIGAHHKTEMLDKGEWRPTAKAVDPKFRSYHISSLYIPTGLGLSWGGLAMEWIASEGNIEARKAFINTKLAETWEERGEAPEWQRLFDRREDYQLGTAPLGVLLVTAGVDVQRAPARIECSVWGWGRGKESWLIDHQVFAGDPFLDDVWKQLGDYLAKPITHQGGGTIGVSRVAVDTGFATHEAYDWCRSKGEWAMAVDGRHGASLPIISSAKAVDINRKGKAARGSVLLWPVGTWRSKSEFYGLVRIERENDDTPPGWVHLPKVDSEFCQQLVAEQFITSKKGKGPVKQRWEKVRDRNEALDCRIYARAAHAALGGDRYTEAQWDELERFVARRTDVQTQQPRQGRRSIPGRS